MKFTLLLAILSMASFAQSQHLEYSDVTETGGQVGVAADGISIEGLVRATTGDVYGKLSAGVKITDTETYDTFNGAKQVNLKTNFIASVSGGVNLLENISVGLIAGVAPESEIKGYYMTPYGLQQDVETKANGFVGYEADVHFAVGQNKDIGIGATVNTRSLSSIDNTTFNFKVTKIIGRSGGRKKKKDAWSGRR